MVRDNVLPFWPNEHNKKYTQKMLGCTSRAVFKLIYLLANTKDILLFPNTIFSEGVKKKS